jgi:hypothetical protein|tara:strand:+ start:4704 stop:4928 length:225 start_codon:yes stop_codon:yes gene_type:complete
MVLKEQTVMWLHHIVYENLEQLVIELEDCRFEAAERRAKRVMRYIGTLQLHETVEDPKVDFSELRKEGKHEISD